MSKRNSAEAKRAARERLRAEREKQAKRERIRRQLTVAGAVVVVLAIAGGIGLAVANMGDDGSGDATDWEAVQEQLDAASEGDGDNSDNSDNSDNADNADSGENAEGTPSYPIEAPAHASGEDGLTIEIGDEDAEHTLTLYEDPRCPACASFEQLMGENVRQGMEDGTYRVQYVFGTFLDGVAGGTGSKNALSALGAALNVSEEAFLDLHDALYTAENHPPESEDAFGDDEHLIELAQSVPELENNRQFERDVRNSTFAAWALQMSEKLNNAEGVEGTPTLAWNDEIIQTPQTAEEFEAMVEQNTQ